MTCNESACVVRAWSRRSVKTGRWIGRNCTRYAASRSAQNRKLRTARHAAQSAQKNLQTSLPLQRTICEDSAPLSRRIIFFLHAQLHVSSSRFLWLHTMRIMRPASRPASPPPSSSHKPAPRARGIWACSPHSRRASRAAPRPTGSKSPGGPASAACESRTAPSRIGASAGSRCSHSGGTGSSIIRIRCGPRRCSASRAAA